MPNEILDLKRPHKCALTGRPGQPGMALCTDCHNGMRPVCRYEDFAMSMGCDLIEQDGELYGWSESNLQYERLAGGACADRYMGSGGLPEAAKPGAKTDLAQ